MPSPERPFTILIVDDDLDDTELLQEAIQETEPTAHCLHAGNGEEALRVLRRAAEPLPHLIFLDLNMPRMNGKTFLRCLKEAEALAHIPVVIYTTSKLEEDIAETRQLGAEHFITKPDSYDGICDAVISVLAQEWVGRI